MNLSHARDTSRPLPPVHVAQGVKIGRRCRVKCERRLTVKLPWQTASSGLRQAFLTPSRKWNVHRDSRDDVDLRKGAGSNPRAYRDHRTARIATRSSAPSIRTWPATLSAFAAPLPDPKNAALVDDSSTYW